MQRSIRHTAYESVEDIKTKLVGESRTEKAGQDRRQTATSGGRKWERESDRNAHKMMNREMIAVVAVQRKRKRTSKQRACDEENTEGQRNDDRAMSLSSLVSSRLDAGGQFS